MQGALRSTRELINRMNYFHGMAPHHDTSAPETPISSTSHEHSTRSPSSFFRNRFSNASLLSLSSVRSILPQYSAADTLEEPAGTHSETATTGNRTSLSSVPSSWNTPTAIEPPRYSLLQPRHSSMLSSRTASTASPFEVQVEGDPQAQAHEFRYSYPIRPKNPWATLHLHTRDATPGTHSKSLQNRPRVPRFWSCDPIKGTLQLDLDTSQNIQQISITINGIIVLSSHSGGSLPFLSREFTLWNKSMGDPLQSDIADSSTATSQKKKNDSRLSPGHHSFPFSFPFPAHADPPSATSAISPFLRQTVGSTVSNVASPSSPRYEDGPKNTEKPQRRWSRRLTSAPNEPPSPTKLQTPDHPLRQPRHSCATSMPQTFMEKDIDPSVEYDISVRIVHGIFKASSKIKTNIAYFPASEPNPASQMRREAYEAGALLPCPMNDTEGWFALPTATTYGVVKIDDNLLHTRVDCTLYIAQPLSYTRGSIIPCFMTVHSDSVELDHLLSNIEMLPVRLLRRVCHPMVESENPSPERGFAGLNPSNTSWAYILVPTSEMNVVTHEVGRANWWTPPKDIVQGPNERHLEGEIHLSPDLQPSCDFQLFRVEYAVELMSFQTSNFKPEVHPPSPGLLVPREADDVLASNLVEITTLYRQDEPVPTAYSEPPKAYHKRCVSSEKAL